MPSNQISGGAAGTVDLAVTLGTISIVGGTSSGSGTFTLPAWANSVIAVDKTYTHNWAFQVQGNGTGATYFSTNQDGTPLKSVPVIPAVDSSVTLTVLGDTIDVGAFTVIAVSAGNPAFDSFTLRNQPVFVQQTRSQAVDAFPGTAFHYLTQPTNASGTDVTTLIDAAGSGQEIVVDSFYADVAPCTGVGTTFAILEITNSVNAVLSFIALVRGITVNYAQLYGAGPILITGTDRLQQRIGNVDGAARAFTLSVNYRKYTAALYSP